MIMIGQKESIDSKAIKQVMFEDIWDNYPSGRPPFTEPSPKDPDKLLYEDQCAIRVSIALLGAGVQLAGFTGVTAKLTAKNLRGALSKNSELVAKQAAIRATELQKWLDKRPFTGLYKSKEITGKNYEDKIADSSGIIYFEDYWRRGESEASRNGDHIDLWNGNWIDRLASLGGAVSILRVHMGISRDGSWSDYQLAKKYCFGR